ncbi:hypothetical protein RKE29_24420 [Streptomyces sp. B1866]|uniref:hypothetical protein n=1 Tax=Streptomyces sp. B1866 TaxID=3075431 RepID=UPI00288E7862|nr:hypothetical protein [Streptomyces sp. B1866]MDT3399744.1 hypothetical protein [Streptomyces sp. B1866]
MAQQPEDTSRPGPPGTPERDPWAPPEQRVPLDKPAGGPPVPPDAPPFAQPTVTALPVPGASGPVPPPPPAPTGPGTPSAQQPGPPGGFAAPGGNPYAGQPGGQPPYGQPGYGYPGYPQAPYGPGWPVGPVPDNGQGTAALVLGIIGLVAFFTVVFGAILGVLAIVFGALGRAKAGRGTATNGGQALAGLICGVIAVVASVVMIFVYIAVDEDDDSAYDTLAAVRVLPGAGPAA